MISVVRLGTAALMMALGVMVAATAAAASPVTYDCPLKLGVAASEKLPEGWWRGDRNETPVPATPKVKGRLSEIWVISGKRGEEQKEAPAILVPDAPDGGWDLSAESDGVLIACIYAGSSSYYATALPAGIKSCVVKGKFDNKSMTLSSGKIACK